MSDDDREDRDIDIESDDDDSDNFKQQRNSSGQNFSQAEKRAHHNALERKRRDHIKDSFTSLRDAVPSLAGEKVASRAQILKKAAEYIQFMRRKNQSHQQDIEDLKRQNGILESQIRALERAKGSFALGESHELRIKSEESESSENEDPELIGRVSKKPKISNYINVS